MCQPSDILPNRVINALMSAIYETDLRLVIVRVHSRAYHNVFLNETMKFIHARAGNHRGFQSPAARASGKETSPAPSAPALFRNSRRSIPLMDGSSLDGSSLAPFPRAPAEMIRAGRIYHTRKLCTAMSFPSRITDGRMVQPRERDAFG